MNSNTVTTVQARALPRRMVEPLVFVEMGEHGYLRVVKQGDVAIGWVWECALPERSVMPLNDFNDPGPQYAWLGGFDGDVEGPASFDIAKHKALGKERMLEALETDQPVVLPYLDDGGWFHILQHGEVGVRCAEHLAPLGKVTIWRVWRYVIRDLVTGERDWFHPQDPLGMDRDAVICPGGF